MYILIVAREKIQIYLFIYMKDPFCHISKVSTYKISSIILYGSINGFLVNTEWQNQTLIYNQSLSLNQEIRVKVKGHLVAKVIKDDDVT